MKKIKRNYGLALVSLGLAVLAMTAAGCSDAVTKALALTQTESFAAQLTSAYITTLLPSPFASSTTSQ